MALAELGEERLVSINDTSVRAQGIRDTYDEVRQVCLRKYPYNFATRRAILGPDGTTPAFKWTYRFALPAATNNDGGWLRTIAVYLDGDERQRADYEEAEGKFLLANVDTLYFSYIVDVADLNRWDVLARQVFIYMLAARLAITLTNSAQLSQGMMVKADAAYKEAASVDSQDSAPHIISAGSWELARFDGGWLSPDDIEIS